MNTTTYRIPRHPVWPTVLIMLAGAAIGALLGVAIAFVTAVSAAASAAPMAFYVNGPAIVTSFAVLGLAVVAITPIWGLIGGMVFANMVSGRSGATALAFQVRFFSEGHDISRAAHRLSERLGIPPPAFIGWYDAGDINAFAMGTGDRNALIALSKGAIEKLDRNQLDAVIAHELGHIASNDMARMTYAQGVQNSLTFFLVFRGLRHLARWVFTPLSQLEIMRFSRRREYTADAISAHVTSPTTMISVLEAVRDQGTRPVTRGRATMMMNAATLGSPFSSHPPLEFRIYALKVLQKKAEQENWQSVEVPEASEGIPG